MNHAQFTSFGMAGGTIPGFSSRSDETKLKCEAIYNITLCFLDAFVRNRDTGSDKRVREDIGRLLPEGIMSLSSISR